jgi:hypothetical protein
MLMRKNKQWFPILTLARLSSFAITNPEKAESFVFFAFRTCAPSAA